jgi:colanic acid biosynthesis glycosyl transferase WcaI
LALRLLGAACRLVAMPSNLAILITTNYYWPEDSGSAPYLTGLAEHLAETGNRVLVATTFPHYPEWQSGANGRIGATDAERGVQIRRRWNYVPHSQSALQRAGYEASLFALGLTALPWRMRPDLVIGTSPSLAGSVLAATAARRQRLAKGAARVGVIAEGFRRYFVEGGVAPERVDRLRNWTRRAEPSASRSEMRQRFGWGDDDFVCVHGGNMGQKQGLDNLLETAALLPRDGIRIAFVGDGNDRPRLEQIARERDLLNVNFVEMQGPGNWEATMEAADVLLVNQRASVMDMSLPSKLTSYFASGKPVLAAVSADSETAYEIQSAGAGVVVAPSDPEEFRDALLSLRDDRAGTEALGAGGRAYAEQKLARQAALAEYDTFIERILAARASK